MADVVRFVPLSRGPRLQMTPGRVAPFVRSETSTQAVLTDLIAQLHQLAATRPLLILVMHRFVARRIGEVVPTTSGGAR